MRRGRLSIVIVICIVVCLLLLVSFLACVNTGGLDGMMEQSDELFADQAFKTAIALIELHKIRYGEYPESLSDLEFTGSWDGLCLQQVSYERLDNGYALNVTTRVSDSSTPPPELCFPDEFWQGLGIVESNVERCNP